MNLSDYFRVIVCRLIMACYVGHSARDFFLKDPITPPNLNIINNLRFSTHNCVILVPKRASLAGEKHTPRSSVVVKPLLD